MWKNSKTPLMMSLSLSAVMTLSLSQAQAQDAGGWYDSSYTAVNTQEDVVLTTNPVTGVTTDQYGKTYSKKEVLCHKFDKVDVVIDGVKTKRYAITKPELLQCAPAQPKAPWKVLKEEWSQNDETNWKNFVQSIGKSSCNTLDKCLASSANPFRNQIDMDAIFYADCADFPMYLRAYFAYKNNLPFSFGITLTQNALNTDQLESIEKARQQAIAKGQERDFESTLKDLRYSKNGNHFGTRINTPNSAGAGRDFFVVADNIMNQISSGSYRMLLTPPGKPLADFYSPAINKEAITVGTVLYKASGHVSIIYDITPEGEVRFMDAHPDGSVSRGSYSKEYALSRPTHGAGFKNWRPLKVVNAVRNSEGAITKGTIQFTPDNQIPNFSLEQYFGNVDVYNTNSGTAKWRAQGRDMSIHDFVRVRLANGVYKLNPLFQFKKDVNSLCMDLQRRASSVETAIQVGLHLTDHPVRLPRNIYGTDGDWESYSTPGSDLRIRKRVKDLMDSAEEYMKKWKSRDPYFDYSGKNLKADLMKVYYEQDASCKISYNNSNKDVVTMGLSTALKRLARVSFDPYLCPERRWGANSPAELATCSETSDKANWYEYQQFLRNSTERDPTEVMGWSLNELQTMVKNGAVDNKDKSTEFNLIKRLEAL